MCQKEQKQIVTAIASFGMSGSIFHAPLLHTHRGFLLKKILQRHSRSALDKYPYITIAKKYEELLSDNEIELIVVNTPDNMHFDFAFQALEAGKHVVVEKPFTTKVSDGEKLIALAREKNRILSVFQNRRWDGDFLTVQKIIRNKVLGRLVEYEAHFDRYRNYIQDSWKEKPGYQTGTLYNLGSHLIDQALVLFGMPDAVYADIRIMRTGGKVDDAFDLKLYYKDIKVTLKAGYLVREPGPKFMVHGTEGSFVKYGIDPQEEDLKQGLLPDKSNWGTEPESEWGILNTDKDGIHIRTRIRTLPGCYIDYYSNIYDVIVKNTELSVKPIEALNVIRIIEAAYMSSDKRQSVSLTY
ncbi:MAG: Gfo/Idh/MocA family oxidoreductase [Bacteroidales bacterium]|nr:Gfo/Idh/MocA family oxidoreductase [Bacteroidales bacterium]